MTSATLIANYQGEGLAAARPATPNIDTGAYATYYAMDTKVFSAYVNGAWQTIGSGIDLFGPPLASAFPTIVNGGSASPAPSVTDTVAGMLFDSGPTLNSDGIRAALQPIPNATTFTIICGMRMSLIALPYRALGIGLYDGTKFVTLYQIAATLQVNNFTNLTSFSSAPVSLAVGPYAQYYFKIVGDGTNLKFSVSWDGRNFIQILSTLVGAWLSTITKCGIVSNANENTSPPAAGDHIFGDVFYWSATTP